MKNTTSLLKIKSQFGTYKWPSLKKLYLFVTGNEIERQHDALFDVLHLSQCIYSLLQKNMISI